MDQQRASAFIVVEDPKGEYWEGAVVNQEYATVLKSRGVALLQVEPHLFRASAIAGFFKRAWGSGWPLDALAPRMHCPMTLYAFKELQALHWAARIVPASQAVADQMAEGKGVGTLRFTGDTGQCVGFAGGIMNTGGCYIEAQKLGKPDERGGWTVGGSTVLQVQTEGLFACALYGAAAGLRVVWAAVSQSA